MIHFQSAIFSFASFVNKSQFKEVTFSLTLLHSQRPKLYTILAFLSAVGLRVPGRFLLEEPCPGGGGGGGGKQEVTKVVSLYKNDRKAWHYSSTP